MGWLLIAIGLLKFSHADFQLKSSANAVTLLRQEKFSAFMPQANSDWDATVAFVSDDILVVQLCNPPRQNVVCSTLVSLQISDQGFRILAQVEMSTHVSLLRIENEGFAAVVHYSTLFTPDLSFRNTTAPNVAMSSLSGKTVASVPVGDVSTVFQICPGLGCAKKIEEVKYLESVSDEATAVREGNTIRIQTILGQELGRFQVPPKSRCQLSLKILDSQRAFESCSHDSIIDWQGRELRRIKAPDLWGTRNGWALMAAEFSMTDMFTRYPL
jgi:hypothetical protein